LWYIVVKYSIKHSHSDAVSWMSRVICSTQSRLALGATKFLELNLYSPMYLHGEDFYLSHLP